MAAAALTQAALLVPGVGNSGIAWAQSPAAARKPQIFAVPLGKGPNVSQLAASQIQHALRQVLELNDHFHLMSDEDLIVSVKKKRKGPSPATVAIEAAGRALIQAHDLVAKGKHRKALPLLRDVIAKLEKYYAELVDYDQLVDAYFQLAVASTALGFEDDAENALMRVYSMRPTFTVDRRVYSKKFLALWDGVVARMGKFVPGVLEIESQPPGARIYVDGLLRGNAPVKISDLYAGKHYIQARASGFKTWATVVKAPQRANRHKVVARLEPEAGTGEVSGEYIDPEPLKVYAETGTFGANFHRAAKSFCSRAQADFLLYTYVVHTRGGYEVNFYLYSAADDTIAELDPVVVDAQLSDTQLKMLNADKIITDAVQHFPRSRALREIPPRAYRLAEEASFAPPEPLVPVQEQPQAAQGQQAPPPGVEDVFGNYPTVDQAAVLEGRSKKTPLYKKWWFWTLIGVGVAGAGVGTAWALGAFKKGGASGLAPVVQLP